MINDIETKIADLRVDYIKNLPNKLADIEELWDKLLVESNPVEAADLLSKLHNKIHGLYGSASIYKFNELANVAKRLESFLSWLDEALPLENEHRKHIQELMKEMKDNIVHLGTTHSSFMDNPQAFIKSFILPETRVLEKQEVKVVYLLESKKEYATNLSKEAAIFGYEIMVFDTLEKLINSLANHSPAALIININMLETLKEDEIGRLNTQYFKNIPRVFIANNGDFALRFKAVQLGGQAYLVKPFLIDEMIIELDHLLSLDDEIYRVLIVDDEEDVAKYYSAVLKQAGMVTHYITKASDIDNVLYDFVPDIVLMDIYMPDCSGYQLSAIIRQQKFYESMPIIYLSRESDKAKQLQFMSVGVDDFVTKTTEPEHLIQVIKNKANRYKGIRMTMMMDSLTGVYNHSYILQQLQSEIKKNGAMRSGFSVGMVNLDDLTKINDTYGYSTGDHVIKNLCLVMRKYIYGYNTLGRYNNENFLLILPKLDSESAKYLLNEIREQFQHINYTRDYKKFNSTFSAGVTVFPEFCTPTDIIHAASAALERAKDSGKNRVEILLP